MQAWSLSEHGPGLGPGPQPHYRVGAKSPWAPAPPPQWWQMRAICTAARSRRPALAARTLAASSGAAQHCGHRGADAAVKASHTCARMQACRVGGLVLSVPGHCRPAEGRHSCGDAVRHMLLSAQCMLCSAGAGRATCAYGPALLPQALCPGQPTMSSGLPVGWLLALYAVQCGAKKPAHLCTTTACT